VGVSIVLSLSKIEKSDFLTYLKIYKRTLIIFSIGIFISLFPDFDFSNVRIAGMLQPIALVYFLCSMIYLNTKTSHQIWIGFFSLIIYWIFMTKISFGNTLARVLEPGNNFAAWIDQFITPGRLYQKTWDLEGFFSTIPAISTRISGMFSGHIILQKKIQA